jgi:integrase/recombinase XerD
MIEDMTVRRFTAKTQSDYIRSVRNLAVFLGRSPDTATAEDLRLFQLHLTETHIRPPTINGTVSALRFFFTASIHRMRSLVPEINIVCNYSPLCGSMTRV